MLGRTPGIRRGHQADERRGLADFKVTEKMLTYFIQKAHNRRVLVHPRIVIGVPSEITPVEKRRAGTLPIARRQRSVSRRAGMAAAIGAGPAD